jgi:hypothetical protein
MSAGTRAQPLYIDATYEVDERGFVLDRYSISFKPTQPGEQPVVQPPNPANRGKVPFGYPTSMQDPAEIEGALGLNGKVLSIMDGSNSVVVRMSAREAERLRADPRVKSVEQDFVISVPLYPGEGQQFLPLGNIHNPRLLSADTHLLRIPLVDDKLIPGLYQDVTIEYRPETMSWNLFGYLKGLPVEEITDVDLVMTTDTPVQAFVKIQGKFPNGCRQLGKVASRKTGTTFEVYLYYLHGTSTSGSPCAGGEVPYTKVVPLDVYGLPANTYRWVVNGRFTGTFTLPADNVLE